MEREILFRGKTETDCRWIYGDLIHYGKYMSIRCNIPDKLGIPNYIEYIVNPNTVCQFTGLTDKNGIKIFEGDKIKTDEDNEYCLVVFNKEEARFQLDLYGYSVSYGEGSQEIYSDTLELIDENVCDFSEYSDIEIIGNIHDNPELLI